MHIPDGLISIEVAGSAIAVSVGYGILAHKSIKNQMTDNTNIPLIASVTSFIFAAQMLNFPIFIGASGHFMGATFATALFGPFVTFFIISIVLLIQALLFGDGGLLSIGTNTLNMAILAPLTAHFILLILKNKSSLFFASLFSILIAAVGCTFVLFLSGVAKLLPTLLIMLSTHTLIGIGEGIITSSALAFIKRAQIGKIKISYETT